MVCQGLCNFPVLGKLISLSQFAADEEADVLHCAALASSGEMATTVAVDLGSVGGDDVHRRQARSCKAASTGGDHPTVQ